jgi:hypothetical protein
MDLILTALHDFYLLLDRQLLKLRWRKARLLSRRNRA